MWVSSWHGCCSSCPNPKSKHNMIWKGYISVASHNKPNTSCNFNSDLKQFIIKYEHFFTRTIILYKKQNHTTKIAGVWFTTYELWFEITFTWVSNLQQQQKISSGLAVVLLKFSGVITLTRVIYALLKSWGWMFKRFSEVELYSPLEVKVNPWLGEQFYHMSSVDVESVSSFLYGFSLL